MSKKTKQQVKLTKCKNETCARGRDNLESLIDTNIKRERKITLSKKTTPARKKTRKMRKELIRRGAREIRRG